MTNARPPGPGLTDTSVINTGLADPDPTHFGPTDAQPTARTPDRDPALRPATADELAESFSFALRFDGRRRVHHADDLMARITADRLVQHLTASGFVVLCHPGTRAPSDVAIVDRRRQDDPDRRPVPPGRMSGRGT